jgi:hypothetical protein
MASACVVLAGWVTPARQSFFGLVRSHRLHPHLQPVAQAVPAALLDCWASLASAEREELEGEPEARPEEQEAPMEATPRTALAVAW